MTDLKSAFRQLLRSPGFTTVALLALAIGIGANVTIFSFVDRLLFRPVHLPEVHRLVSFWTTDSGQVGGSRTRFGITPADFRDWQQAFTSFDHLAAAQSWQVAASGEGEPEQLWAQRVTANFFAALGVGPAHGAAFTADHEVPGRADVVILSHRLWQRRYAGAADLIGQTIRLAGRPHTVLGVMPETFDYPIGTELWVPLALPPGEWALRGLGDSHLQPVGRLKHNLTVAAAHAELDAVMSRLAEAHPQTNGRRVARLLPLSERVVDESGSRLLMTLVGGATLFVLALVCANLANYQLARGLDRARELAIRAALGATRGRLVRQLLVENLVLATAGGLLGAALAVAGVRTLQAAMPGEIALAVPGWTLVTVNHRSWLCMLALVLLASALAGLLPALAVSQPRLGEALKEGTHQATTGRQRRWLRQGLVALQVMLALLLLTGNGLFVKSFLALTSFGTSFPVDQVLTFEVTRPSRLATDTPVQEDWWQRAVEELAAIPGVEAVGVAGRSAVDQWFPRLVEFENAPTAPPGQPQRVPTQAISPGYFNVLGLPLRLGRAFDARDDLSALPVAILTESAARRFFPAEDPVGRRFQTPKGSSGPPQWVTIIGVVADPRVGPQTLNPAAVIFPLAQGADQQLTFLLRTTADASSVIPAVRERMRTLHPDLPLLRLASLRDALRANIGALPVVAGLLAGAAAVALGLAALGLYSVLAQAVAQRRQEIGVRLALGAQRRDILRVMLRGGMAPALVGLSVGLPLALGFGWLLAGELGSDLPLSAVEPGVLTGAAGLLLAVAAVAVFLPARRAAQVDPLQALRSE
ncbi:MAG: ABC transporter permease [Verrucomicrobiales bacterium]|nr:ABC transporter permease [Verrucomicrobiales bacterium]